MWLGVVNAQGVSWFFALRTVVRRSVLARFSEKWSGGVVRIDTADKQRLVLKPQQQHNLSMAPNRAVLLCGPPNRGKSATCLQIAAYSAPFHKVFVLHGTPGTVEYDCVDHTLLDSMPDPEFWKEQSKAA
eukprot:COSAG03_NODE_7980_length_849_cov_1.114667_1_plen_129_part_10